jgi:signal transduction histidine kinase
MNRSAVAARGKLRLEGVAGWVAAGATVLIVYVAVVLGGGALTGQTDSPSLGLSLLATAVVAGLAPRVLAGVERYAARRLGKDHPSSYDVLADFSRVAGSELGGRAPSVIARMLVQGLAAEWAQVWVLVEGHLRLVATHPEHVSTQEPAPRLYHDPVSEGVRAVTVAHAGRPLGVIRIRARDGRPLDPTADRLLGGLAAQAGLVLESAQLHEELGERLRELTVRERELRVARERLVRAQDHERRRLERDIHDGAQQQLVALAINLKLAAVLAESDPTRARTVLHEQLTATDDAIRTLSDLTEGLLPPVLATGGPAAALQEATMANPVPVRVRAGQLPRLPHAVEATLFFCALEAVQNATKHAECTRIEVTLRADDRTLAVTIDDDGSGIPSGAREGRGLTNLRERATSIGARLEIGDRPGGGTRIALHVPVSVSGQSRAVT